MRLKKELRNYKQIELMKKYFILYIFFIGLLSGCKSTKITTEVKSNIKPLTIEQIFENQKIANLNIHTVLAKIKVKYITAKKTQNITAKLRVKKDTTIWISLTAIGGIPIAKMIITPYSVRYYEKLNKTYFDGNFSLLNHWLKTDLNFNKLQNMLFAQPIIPSDSGKFLLDITNKSYQLSSKKKIDNTKVTYWINPTNFKLDKQQFSKNKKEYLSFNYLGFDTSTSFRYPNKMFVIAASKKQTIKINLTYKSLKFDLPLNFPFKIPKGYKQLKVK